MRQRMFGWGDVASVHDVIANTRKRSEARQNFLVPSVLDLNLRYVDPNPKLPKGGYTATIEGKELPIGETGFKTACRMIRSKPDYFKQFSDPNAFPQSMRNIIDNPGRQGPKGVIVRTGLANNGIDEDIVAILPSDYVIRDAFEQIEEFATMLEQTYGNVKGMSVVGQSGNWDSYRFIVGEEVELQQLTPEQRRQHLVDKDGFLQRMMFVLSMSEIGLKKDQTTLGLYRLICTNGAAMLDRFQNLSTWNHKDKSLQTYQENTAGTIRQLGYFGDVWGKIFSDLIATPLDVDATDLLSALNDNKLLASPHAEAASTLVKQIPVKTQYDFYNVLTRAAQDLPSVPAREKAESSALRMFTQPGGVREQLRKAMERRPGRNQPDRFFDDDAEG